MRSSTSACAWNLCGFARMIPVRHRSHATYSRQPRQVRKEATVTGSCVCSGFPVPGLFLSSLANPACQSGFTHNLQLFAQEAPRRLILSSKGWQTIARGAVQNMRNARIPSNFVSPTVTIRVSGSLSQGHLAYVDQLVSSAIECALWPLLDLAHLMELDHDALMYLVGGEGRHFGIVGCPNFIREWMQYEKDSQAA